MTTEINFSQRKQNINLMKLSQKTVHQLKLINCLNLPTGKEKLKKQKLFAPARLCPTGVAAGTLASADEATLAGSPGGFRAPEQQALTIPHEHGL